MSKCHSTQLTLNIRLDETATFTNFYSGNNQALLFALHEMINGGGESFLYCWGGEGVGRSHLLQAACQSVHEQGRLAAYIPLSRFRSLSPTLLEGLESMALVCLDDVNEVLGQPEWEIALFHFYNRLQEGGVRLLVSANSAPQQLPDGLADLRSRLAAGLVFHIPSLTDEEKLAALQLRAELRGFRLPEKVGQFLLHHQHRNFSSLFSLLEQLDAASLVAQKKLTIPFLKTVLTHGISDPRSLG